MTYLQDKYMNIKSCYKEFSPLCLWVHNSWNYSILCSIFSFVIFCRSTWRFRHTAYRAARPIHVVRECLNYNSFAGITQVDDFTYSGIEFYIIHNTGRNVVWHTLQSMVRKNMFIISKSWSPPLKGFQAALFQCCITNTCEYGHT